VNSLHAVGISKNFGGLQALRQVDIRVMPGQIVGLIGPNGAGKSTLLSILAGEQPPTSGQILLQERPITRLSAPRRSRLGIARTFQNLRLFREMTAFENVVAGCVAWRTGHPLTRRPAVGSAATAALERVRLPRVVWRRPAGELPYIQQRLLEIARCLATKPQYLLLDEPVAGANDPERDTLADVVVDIAREGAGVIVIEHDMRFLFRLAEVVTVLDHGEVISRGDPRQVQTDRAVIDAYLGTGTGTGR